MRIIFLNIEESCRFNQNTVFQADWTTENIFKMDPKNPRHTKRQTNQPTNQQINQQICQNILNFFSDY